MKLATINADTCVGCNRCYLACPVDAIIGTVGHLHIVLTEECIGCGLCQAPCPVDCIKMHSVQVANKRERAERAKKRYQARQRRLQQRHCLPPTKRHVATKTKIKTELAGIMSLYDQEHH